MNDRIDHVVASIPELSGQRTSVSVLKGGLTNSNYKVETASASYVLRLAGPNSSLLGIDRQFEYENSVTAASLGVGPAVVAFLPSEGALVTSFLPGQVLSPLDVRVTSILQRVVESLRSFHSQKNVIKGTFSGFGAARAYYAVARERNVYFPANIDSILDRLNELEQLVAKQPAVNCPCHNDLLTANFIDDGDKVKIIDWEYAGIGDLFFDLGNLASNGEFESEHEEMLLGMYFGEATKERWHKLKLMRLVSDLRETMWGFLQIGISELDIDYVSYSKDYLDRFLCGYEKLETAIAKL